MCSQPSRSTGCVAAVVQLDRSIAIEQTHDRQHRRLTIVDPPADEPNPFVCRTWDARQEHNPYTALAYEARAARVVQMLPAEFLLPFDTIEYDGERLTVSDVRLTASVAVLSFDGCVYDLTISRSRLVRLFDPTLAAA